MERLDTAALGVIKNARVRPTGSSSAVQLHSVTFVLGRDDSERSAVHTQTRAEMKERPSAR